MKQLSTEAQDRKARNTTARTLCVDDSRHPHRAWGKADYRSAAQPNLTHAVREGLR
jgi:hypothetical protein